MCAIPACAFRRWRRRAADLETAFPVSAQPCQSVRTERRHKVRSAPRARLCAMQERGGGSVLLPAPRPAGRVLGFEQGEGAGKQEEQLPSIHLPGTGGVWLVGCSRLSRLAARCRWRLSWNLMGGTAASNAMARIGVVLKAVQTCRDALFWTFSRVSTRYVARRVSSRPRSRRGGTGGRTADGFHGDEIAIGHALHCPELGDRCFVGHFLVEVDSDPVRRRARAWTMNGPFAPCSVTEAVKSASLLRVRSLLCNVALPFGARCRRSGADLRRGGHLLRRCPRRRIDSRRPRTRRETGGWHGQGRRWRSEAPVRVLAPASAAGCRWRG